MLAIEPFKALRPARQYAQAVAAPPYDVVGLAEANEILANNPLSFLQVEKTGLGLKEELPLDDETPFLNSKANLTRLIQQGVLFQDPKPCFYLYRLAIEGRRQLGLVSCLNVAQYEQGLIKKHELTRSDKQLDRIKHIMTVASQTGPVFIAYRAVKAIDDLMARLAAAPPEYSFVADDGVEHTIWVVADSQDTNEIRQKFSLLPALYIADGHHRAAAAAEAARRFRQFHPESSRLLPSDFLLSVLFPHDQLWIMAYNRLVKGLGGHSPEEFLERIREHFLLNLDVQTMTPRAANEFCIYFQGRWHHLQAQNHPPDRTDPLANIPAHLLQERLLAPVLGISDPRLSDRVDFIGGSRGTAELDRLVDSGQFDLAIILHPTSIEDLMRVADAGLLMPPKSTWFEPKLRSGLFTHLLTGP